jgi:myo-inositol-1(or 4)-monophosphatase
MAARSALFTVIERAVRNAARGLVRDFGEVEQLQVSLKGPSDFVSNADLQAERTLRAELEKIRPGAGFLMEESGDSPGDGVHRWIVDPLDGTTNFLHGLPHFCISVALEKNQQLVAGLVYDPIKDEMFWAERGQGAYLNNRRIRVSARRALGESLVATGIPYRAHGDHARYLKILGAVMGEVAGVRRMGAAALDLAYVACGRCDAFFELGLSPWDVAAGILLIREAGGYVDALGRRGDPLTAPGVVAANDHLIAPFHKILRGADPGLSKD